jgi:hypothetical protein
MFRRVYIGWLNMNSEAIPLSPPYPFQYVASGKAAYAGGDGEAAKLKRQLR